MKRLLLKRTILKVLNAQSYDSLHMHTKIGHEAIDHHSRIQKNPDKLIPTSMPLTFRSKDSEIIHRLGVINN